jgi:hypothetical protein
MLNNECYTLLDEGKLKIKKLEDECNKKNQT